MLFTEMPPEKFDEVVDTIIHSTKYQHQIAKNQKKCQLVYLNVFESVEYSGKFTYIPNSLDEKREIYVFQVERKVFFGFSLFGFFLGITEDKKTVPKEGLTLFYGDKESLKKSLIEFQKEHFHTDNALHFEKKLACLMKSIEKE
jgi:hypothetical protein